MARKAGQGKEEEESRARQQEEKTPVREGEKTPARHGRGHHVVEQEWLRQKKQRTENADTDMEKEERFFGAGRSTKHCSFYGNQCGRS
ncbi:hypothetical protein STEG23_009345 [Scotinomys teguina]